MIKNRKVATSTCHSLCNTHHTSQDLNTSHPNKSSLKDKVATATQGQAKLNPSQCGLELHFPRLTSSPPLLCSSSLLSLYFGAKLCKSDGTAAGSRARHPLSPVPPAPSCSYPCLSASPSPSPPFAVLSSMSGACLALLFPLDLTDLAATSVWALRLGN